MTLLFEWAENSEPQFELIAQGDGEAAVACCGVVSGIIHASEAKIVAGIEGDVLVFVGKPSRMPFQHQSQSQNSKWNSRHVVKVGVKMNAETRSVEDWVIR